jgi:hypothetical protein
MQYLTDEAAAEKIDNILSVSGEISLSNDKAFNDLYIDYINFEET